MVGWAAPLTMVAPVRAIATAALALVAAAVVLTGCGPGSGHGTKSAAPTTPVTTVPGPLQAPSATSGQEAQYLTDVSEADPTLATYAQSQGDVGARALLTDGSAFCAFLKRDGDVDGALVSLAVGARSVQSQTHLPLGVTTFNTIEAVALLTLCPAEQNLLPAPDRSRINQLGRALGQAQG
jgi:hypothetical protein